MLNCACHTSMYCFWFTQEEHPKFGPAFTIKATSFTNEESRSRGVRDSFCGDKWEPFIKDVSGVTLRQDTIPSKEILHISNSLKKWVRDNEYSCRGVIYEQKHGISVKDGKDLMIMFDKYLQLNPTLSSWW